MYQESIKVFFDSVQKPANDLQRAIHSTLKSERCSALLCALGLVAKYVTGPWQRLLDGKLTILQLNEHYQQLVTTLREWINDPNPVLSGSASAVFPTVPLKKDNVFECLTQSGNATDDTAVLFSSVCREMLVAAERQLSDQLPGGQYWNPSPELVAQSKSCQATNLSGERVFGKLDAAVKKAPNVMTKKLE